MADRTTTPTLADDVSELSALIERGGFWRLVPDWVPRNGYAEPIPETLRAVEAGLRRLVT